MVREVASKGSAVSLDPYSALMNHLLGGVFEDEHMVGRSALTSIATRKHGDKVAAAQVRAWSRCAVTCSCRSSTQGGAFAPQKPELSHRRLPGETSRYGVIMEFFSRANETKAVTAPPVPIPPPASTPVAVTARTAVAPNWAVLPTISHGQTEGQIKLAGPNHYRMNVEGALKLYGSLVMAELRVETIGEYAGAVMDAV
jgi:hypothetical protein